MNQDTLQKNQVDAIILTRRKAKEIRYCFYTLLFLLVIWSIKITIIDDTDWDRIGNIGSVFRSMARFFPPDLSLIKYLFRPTVETFMMAFLGTIIAVILSLPVVWLGARNVTPGSYMTYGIGRLIMTLSRSIHEVVWVCFLYQPLGLVLFPVLWLWQCGPLVLSQR